MTNTNGDWGELEKIPWMDGYKIVTEKELIERDKITCFDQLIIEELEAQEIDVDAVQQNAFYYKGSGVYYNELMYYCLFDAKDRVYYTVIDPVDEQVTLLYTLDAIALNGGELWEAYFYGVTEESYAFYGFTENIGKQYFIFDKETNELIEQTQEIGEEYTKIEVFDHYSYYNRCESFTLNGKEYTIDRVEDELDITAEDYHLTINPDFVMKNVPKIFEIYDETKDRAQLGSYFIYDGFLYFVYHHLLRSSSLLFSSNMPQILFQVDIEQKTAKYVGYVDNRNTIMGVVHVK